MINEAKTLHYLEIAMTQREIDRTLISNDDRSEEPGLATLVQYRVMCKREDR
jgi:hypothetical protein